MRRQPDTGRLLRTAFSYSQSQTLFAGLEHFVVQALGVAVLEAGPVGVFGFLRAVLCLGPDAVIGLRRKVEIGAHRLVALEIVAKPDGDEVLRDVVHPHRVPDSVIVMFGQIEA